MEFLKESDCFTYQCISVKDLKPIMKNVVFGNKHPYEPVKREGEKTSLRKLVLPQYTPQDVQKLEGLLQDSKVSFIAFPVLLIGRITKCSAKDRNMHQTILLYNKATGSVDILDDLFGDVQIHFNYGKYIKTVIQESILPFLRTFVGKRLSVRIGLPMFSESKYKTYLHTLLKYSQPATFANAYKLFLVNLLHERVRNPKMQLKQVIAATEKYVHQDARAIKQYIEFNNYSESYIKDLNLKCEDGETYNMSKRVCERNENQPCTANAFRSISSFKIGCHPTSIEVQEKFASTSPKRDIGSKTYDGIKYIVSKHSNAAMIIPDDPSNDGEYMFSWAYDKDTEEWELQTPLNFEEMWDVGIADPSVRFLVFLIFLRPKEGQVGHVNCMIYDKMNEELERFEPNGDSYDDDLNNGEDLDDAILEIDRFGDLTYHPPASYCPRGFHSRDGHEGPNVVSFGGNCVIWSLWYIDVRLSNPDLPSDVLTKFTYDYIASRGSFKHFVNGYRAYLQKHITSNTYSSVSTPSDMVR
jgi:hypothetical protein